MKSFIIMPFADKYNNIYEIIKDTCTKRSISISRADEISEPGPIINQIFKAIDEASFIIAEVGDQNPNVFYEVGVAHCLSKPTLLLAQSNTIKNLPFDIRHQRILVYNSSRKTEFRENLQLHLQYIKDIINDDLESQSIDTMITNISSKKEDVKDILNRAVEFACNNYQFVDPQITQYKKIGGDQSGIIIHLKDEFQDELIIRLDVNGIFRRIKLIK